MTELPNTYWMRVTEVLCPRCVEHGRHKLQPAFLRELTFNDGEQSVHALACFSVNCRFNEIRSQTGPGHEQVLTLRLQLRRAKRQLWHERLTAACIVGILASLVIVIAALR